MHRHVCGEQDAEETAIQNRSIVFATLPTSLLSNGKEAWGACVFLGGETIKEFLIIQEKGAISSKREAATDANVIASHVGSLEEMFAIQGQALLSIGPN